jgi:hypothetical protein
LAWQFTVAHAAEKMFRIGHLSSGFPTESAILGNAHPLCEQDLAEGRDYALNPLRVEGRHERVPARVRELMG